VTTPSAVETAPPDSCAACRGSLDALGRCGKCGAVFGEVYRCPLCHALSDVEPSPALYYRCRTCGGPRIPPSAGPSSERETALLKSARAEQLRAGAFRAGSGFALASGLLSVLVTNVVLLATSPAPFAKAAALFASVVPLLLSFLAFRQARTHKQRFEQALQEAWLSAAARVAEQAGAPLDAASLAKTLSIDETRAELLLAELSVQDFVRPRLEPAAKVRVTELGDPAELSAAAEADSRRVEDGASKP
jgi:hypothetical protein